MFRYGSGALHDGWFDEWHSIPPTQLGMGMASAFAVGMMSGIPFLLHNLVWHLHLLLV